MNNEETVFHEGKALIDFLDYNPKRAERSYPFVTNVAARQVCISVRRIRPRKNIDKGIFITRTWWGNNFHFTFEGLASLYILYQIDAYKDYPLLVDSFAMGNPWNAKMLHLIEPNRPIVVINGSVCVKNAIFLSRIAWGEQEELKHYIGWHMYKDAANFVRQRVIKAYKAKKTYDKVYVARGDDKRLLNETQLISVMRELGYTIIDPINNTFEDYLGAFMTANILVGVSGTGMVYLAFSKTEAEIYIIVPFEFQHDVMSGLGLATKHGIKYLRAEPCDLKDAMPGSTFEVDLDYVRKALNTSKRQTLRLRIK